MKTTTELKEQKERCRADIRAALPNVKPALDEIDGRVCEYMYDAIRDDMDTANVYELLGIRKVLRLCYAYRINAERVQRVLRAIEGEWDGGTWVRGGLKFDTPRGAQHVRLMPYQVWCLFGIYAFDTDVMMREYREGEVLLPSEHIVEMDNL